MRVLVTGASGMLGSSLIRVLGERHALTGLSRSRPPNARIDWLDVDLRIPGEIGAALGRAEPDVIVHAAAMTNVDECERQPDLAHRVNEGCVGELTAYSKTSGAKLVYISTDAVFDGAAGRPYREEDEPRPLNVYARAKLGGERLALGAPGSLVLRTNIFGWRHGRGGSLAEWILAGLREGRELTTFRDVYFSPIAAVLLADVVASCLDRKLSGLFHAGGAESISKHQFAVKIAEYCGLPTGSLRPISVDEKGLDAPRPKFMSLDSSKLAAAIGSEMPTVERSIAAWLDTEHEENAP